MPFPYGKIAFPFDGETVEAVLYQDGWSCPNAYAQSLLKAVASPRGQCMSQAPFRADLLDQAAKQVGGRVVEKPTYGPLPEGVIA